MRKYMFFIFIVIHTLQSTNLVSCPCEFSSEDKRPFFEQYETTTNTTENKEN